MVFKRSEYGRVFKVQNHVKNIPTYYDNLTYRNQRRELESAHTSIAWVESDSSEETAEKEISKEEIKIAEPPSAAVPVSDKQQKPEKESVCKSEEKIQGGKTTEPSQESKDELDIKRQSKEEEQLKKDARGKLAKYTSKENTDVPGRKIKNVDQKAKERKEHEKPSFNLRPKKVDDKTFVNKVNIPVKPGVSKSRSGARPKSAPSARQSEPARPRPPFLPYGCGDSERVTGTQRSHNVLASTDVYPAAIKAHKKHVEESIRRKDANVKAAKEAKKRRQLFRDKMLRDAAFWKSEYGFRYPAHPTSEYAKNCDKPKRCRSAFGLV
ncbi:centriole, cilia and spindle-associated protein-like [Ylistrum balloti]|uniref:centriole, cilia and spindle-associated protein-like n=1 Tax=Ylistrum balloti TaxID=509963 RepID=UPI002905D5DB|nr:centriole, cilia and spindle-associated protein-like [Ylistrum balloti]